MDNTPPYEGGNQSSNLCTYAKIKSTEESFYKLRNLVGVIGNTLDSKSKVEGS